MGFLQNILLHLQNNFKYNLEEDENNIRDIIKKEFADEINKNKSTRKEIK